MPFDRNNVIGLHHLALTVSDDRSLATLHAALLANADVEIEFAPETLNGGPTRT